MAMDKKTLNIIHLDKNKNRRASFMKQIIEYKINATVWPGIIADLPWKGISQAYKQVVQDAKNSNLPYCIIADDDFSLTCPESWQLFISNMPNDFDIYLAGVSGGVVGEIETEPNVRLVSDWSGTFFFAIHQRFYDIFLNADENKNIDRWLANGIGDNGFEKIKTLLGRNPVYKIRYPMVSICIDSVSDNSGKFMDHAVCFLPYEILSAEKSVSK